MRDRAFIALTLSLLSGTVLAQAAPSSDRNPADVKLPDSPGTLVALAHLPGAQKSAGVQAPATAPCPGGGQTTPTAQGGQSPCPDTNPYQLFLNTKTPIPLSPRQKAYLAFRDVKDPFNLMTIGLNAGFTIGVNSHTAYGPGLAGFGRYSLYSLSQDVTGEVIGTFGVCSLLHEDPHYHRMATGSTPRRFLYAISRTWVAQSDYGRRMPNYEKFITYPASATISNLYVPGIAGNVPSTVKRVSLGLASDPIDNLITEFVPDFASRIHVHVVFVQQLINQMATGQI